MDLCARSARRPSTCFPGVAEDRAIWHLGVERLGRIPIEPSVAGADGAPSLVAKPGSPVAKEFLSFAHAVRVWAQERLTGGLGSGPLLWESRVPP